MQKLAPIIHPEAVANLLAQNPVIIDASAGAEARYNEQHLAGAQFADVNQDLANIGDFALGGRHPLPTTSQFTAVLQKFGITKNSHVLVYDDKNGANAAARFWWMLRAIGHQKVQVIDGGYPAIVKAGLPCNNNIESPTPAEPYQIGTWQLPLANINQVEEVAQNPSYQVIDVRDANRYAGLTEPIDLIAGHIPGAINIPFTENLSADGFFLTPEELKEKYLAKLGKHTPENIIVHCGSGITACHTLLALDYAGLAIPKLYVGSWSEWSRNNKPMVLAEK